jgi:hypothetical protein
MTARAKFIVIVIIALTLIAGLLSAAYYAQDLAQRLRTIAPTLSPMDQVVVDVICAFRDQLLTGVDHARMTAYCTLGI